MNPRKGADLESPRRPPNRRMWVEVLPVRGRQVSDWNSLKSCNLLGIRSFWRPDKVIALQKTAVFGHSRGEFPGSKNRETAPEYLGKRGGAAAYQKGARAALPGTELTSVFDPLRTLRANAIMPTWHVPIAIRRPFGPLIGPSSHGGFVCWFSGSCCQRDSFSPMASSQAG